MGRLDEIRARCEAATPGPWEVKVKGNTVESHQVMSPGNGPICSAISPKTKNAQFIAHAREDIPYLLAEWCAGETAYQELSAQLDCARLRIAELTARAEKVEAERDAYKQVYQRHGNVF